MWRLTNPERFKKITDMLHPFQFTEATPEFKYLASRDLFITVGDYVGNMFGDIPHFRIYDGVTQRTESVDMLEHEDAEIVRNEKGTISDELISAIRHRLITRKYRDIRVDGEEDLAVLPLLAWAKDGTNIVWGDPFLKCSMVVTVNPNTRFLATLAFMSCGEWVEDRKE